MSRVEQFARSLPAATRDSVRQASALKTAARTKALAEFFEDPETAREYAAGVKSHVLDNLGALLVQFESNCVQNGVQVHWAETAAEANRIIVAICQPYGPEVVKAKSMATEEIHLNGALEEAGLKPVETDLGEFVVQLDGDAPSHIVTPIIHKNRAGVAESFEKAGLGEYTEVPEALAAQARAHLRGVFQRARVGISGVNFGVVSTGQLVLVENEGNSRLSTTVPEVHIAVMGIEKLVPDENCLAVFLPLLAGSATGQRVTTYTHFISGPRRNNEADGPREVHLVLLDNGRSRLLARPEYRDILRCIRCGACLNVCPIYRQASGHAYDHVYSGPLGLVLAPALEGVTAMKDLPFASTLCGACEEVCPVKIPIPNMLLKLREEAGGSAMNWRGFAALAGRSAAWKAGLKLLPMVTKLPNPMLKPWKEFRQVPQPKGRSFRGWWRGRA